MENELREKSLLSYIPGFRKNKLSHKIIACFYYLAMLFCCFEYGGIFYFLFGVSIPFMLFHGIDFFKTKKRSSFKIAVVSLVIFLISPFLIETLNPLLSQEVITHNLDGKNYASIEVKKDTIEDITINDYQEFLQKRVSGQNYDWFTINLGDNIGIVFENCDPITAVYGTINSTGEIIAGNRNIRVTSALDAEPLTIELTSIIPKYETSIDNLQKPTHKVSVDQYIEQLDAFSTGYETWSKEFTSYAPTLLAVSDPSEERDQKLRKLESELQNLSANFLNYYPENEIAQEILQPIVHDKICHNARLVCDHIDYFLSNPEQNGKEYASTACAILINEQLPHSIKTAKEEAIALTEKIQAEQATAEQQAAEELVATEKTATAKNEATTNSTSSQTNKKQSYNNDTSGANYIGNSNTKKFHYPTCSSVEDIKPNHIVKLNSREQAINNGYVPCKRCHP